MPRLLPWTLAALAPLAHAAVVDTTNAAAVAAFQAGLTVNTFESVPGATPQPITGYTSGDDVASGAFVFNQLTGVQFSVGGQVGTNRPALFQLGGAIAGDAHSASTVLGPVDFDAKTNFVNGSAFIEVFFPVKVAKVGFWLNPSLGNVLLIAADTNFAFSGLPETTLESGNGTAGHFVGIERPTADIGGFKILASSPNSFTVDDFSYGVSAVPEPASWAMWAAALAGAPALRRRRR